MNLNERYPDETEGLCKKIIDRVKLDKWNEIQVEDLNILKSQLNLQKSPNPHSGFEYEVSQFCEEALITILNDIFQSLDTKNSQVFYTICDIFILVLGKNNEGPNQANLDAILGRLENTLFSVWEKTKILNQQKVAINLQHFLYLLKALVSFCQENECDNFLKTLENLIFDIIDQGDPTCVVFNITRVFPLLRNNSLICQKTWNHISNSLEKDRHTDILEKHSTLITILCCLCDHHFILNQEIDRQDCCGFKLHHEVLFWQVLHLGFLSKNPTTRKRVMYIMKRTIDLCLSEGKSFAVKCPKSPKHFIFYWDSNLTESMTKLWNDFILMLEVLEEKQAHVIKPILPKLDKWLQHSEETKNASFDFLTHPDWLWIVCQRMLNHENNFATRWIINWLLSKDFGQDDKYFHESLIDFSSYHLLPALNDTSSYIREQDDQTNYSKMGELLANFYKKLFDTEEINAQLFSQFLNQLCQIQWGSVPLFYVVNAISSLPSKPYIGTRGIKLLREFLLKVLRTQEPLLRGAIQCKVLSLTFRLINSKEVTYTELSHFLAVFKQSESFKRGTCQWRDVVQWLQNHFIKSAHNLNDTLAVNRALEFCKDEVEHLYQNDIPEENDLESNTPLILDKLECNRLARMIVLIADATNASNFSWRDIFIETTDIMITAHSRAYMSGWKFDKAIQFLSAMLQEGKSFKTSDGLKKSVICQAIIRLIDTSSEDILGYLALKAINSKTSEELNLYATTITLLLKQEELTSSIPTFLSRITHIIRPILQNKFSISYTFCAWRCLSLGCSLAPECPQELVANTLSLISNIIQSEAIHELISKPKQLCTSPVEKQLSTIALNSCWTCIHWFLTHQKTDAKTTLHLANLALESFETGSHDVLIPVLKSLKHLLPSLKSKTVVLNCLKMSWNTCMEVKKNELFRPALKTFISAAYDPDLMSQYTEYLKTKAEEFHTISEGASGIFNMLVEHCLTRWMECELIYREIEPYLPMMQNAVIFGSVHRKDQRVVADLSKYIASFEDKLSTNVLVKSDHLSDSETRCLGMAFILHLSESNPEHVQIACHLAKELIAKDIQVTSERKRHFGNSYIHRVKNRAWQVILLLEHLFLEETRIEILNVIYETLAEESQQPSVRYLQEWFVTKCLHSHPDLLPGFILVMNKKIGLAGFMESLNFFALMGQRPIKCYICKSHGDLALTTGLCSLIADPKKFMISMNPAKPIFQSAQKRVGCIASFLAIIVQLTKGLKKNDEGKLRDFANITLPWCMGQHFTTRIYAHVAFSKIWGKAEELKLESFLKEFRAIHDALIICHDNGNASRNISQMLHDFYFRVFNPEGDFCLETIFYILPKLTKLSSEEWIEPDLIAKTMVKLKLTQNIIPIFSHNSELKNLEPGAWVAKSNWSNLGTSSEANEGGLNFQKKIIPWKQMVPDLGSYEDNFDRELSTKIKSDPEGLIVVATLIDKAPNLGGLCRTCEVFGVSEYVIGNLRFVEDRQFQNLSVTAEKWINVKEVKPLQLKDYLLEMKQKDYVLIGVEQTAESKILTDYHIPKKSLLLLGNEKEGLPVELIHLLDECVEIPQQGVIRSLNVHVSGAILIWEYARQHINNLK